MSIGKKDIVSYSEKDIDTIKSKYDKIISDMDSKLRKVNLAYNAINTVYTKHVKETSIVNRAYKIKIGSLETKLYTIKNTHRDEINDLQSFYKRKIDQLNENVNNLEASIKLLELKNQSISDATLNSDEQTIDSTVDSLDVNFDEDYKLNELILDSGSDNDTNDINHISNNSNDSNDSNDSNESVQ